jgi:hypothetical protein
MKLQEEEIVSELILAKSHELASKVGEKDGLSPLEIQDPSMIRPPIPVPNMWSMDFIGLYCQYAAVGKLYPCHLFG